MSPPSETASPPRSVTSLAMSCAGPASPPLPSGLGAEVVEHEPRALLGERAADGGSDAAAQHR
ncbi:hypothetical protein ACFSTC_21960 [Nonomuraea ferruginea]